ncbi:MAG: class I SAM-dependent methyltransferase [Candidatus Dormibacterales bacterium]
MDLGSRRFVRCANCGLRVLNPAPGPQELANEYDAGYAPFALAARSPDLATRFRRAWYTARRERWLSGLEFSSALDVGCGTGEFLLKLRRRGVDVRGLEPAAYAAQFAASSGLDVFQGGVSDYRPRRTFDLITLWNVVEHLPDPKGDLARLRELLAPAGTMVILTPDAGSHQARAFGRDWAGLEVPKHLVLLDRGSLRALAAKARLVEARVRRARIDHVYMGLASWAAAVRRRGWRKAIRLVPATFTGDDSMLVAWLRRE